MSRASPPLLPIFRSEHQIRLVGFLYVQAGKEFSIADLERETGIPQQTISREVQRLARAGLVVTRSTGRLKLVAANEGSPYFGDLRSLLMKAVGPARIIAERLERVRGIEEAFIFGSWARRYHGEVGPPPADIDVVVVGEADPDEVAAACRTAERRLGLQVNPVVFSTREWASRGSGFIRGVRKGPLVPLVGGAS